jgi:hypothetical protein
MDLQENSFRMNLEWPKEGLHLSCRLRTAALTPAGSIAGRDEVKQGFRPARARDKGWEKVLLEVLELCGGYRTRIGPIRRRPDNSRVPEFVRFLTTKPG